MCIIMGLCAPLTHARVPRMYGPTTCAAIPIANRTSIHQSECQAHALNSDQRTILARIFPRPRPINLGELCFVIDLFLLTLEVELLHARSSVLAKKKKKSLMPESSSMDFFFFSSSRLFSLPLFEYISAHTHL